MDQIDIWRAAKQMLDLYHEGASFAAAQRADAALEQGDTFNVTLWTRVTRAIEELERMRRNDESLN